MATQFKSELHNCTHAIKADGATVYIGSAKAMALEFERMITSPVWADTKLALVELGN